MFQWWGSAAESGTVIWGASSSSSGNTCSCLGIQLHSILPWRQGKTTCADGGSPPLRVIWKSWKPLKICGGWGALELVMSSGVFTSRNRVGTPGRGITWLLAWSAQRSPWPQWFSCPPRPERRAWGRNRLRSRRWSVCRELYTRGPIPPWESRGHIGPWGSLGWPGLLKSSRSMSHPPSEGPVAEPANPACWSARPSWGWVPPPAS